MNGKEAIFVRSASLGTLESMKRTAKHSDAYCLARDAFEAGLRRAAEIMDAESSAHQSCETAYSTARDIIERAS